MKATTLYDAVRAAIITVMVAGAVATMAGRFDAPPPPLVWHQLGTVVVGGPPSNFNPASQLDRSQVEDPNTHR